VAGVTAGGSSFGRVLNVHFQHQYTSGFWVGSEYAVYAIIFFRLL